MSDEEIRRIQEYATSWAYQQLGCWEDAKEVANEVAFVVSQKYDPKRGAKISTFAWSVCHHQCCKRLKKRPPVESISFEGLSVELGDDERGNPLLSLVQQEPKEFLHVVFDGLPPKQREAIQLVFFEGLSHAKAADVLGCDANTVRQRVHQALKNLKKRFAEQVDG